MNTQPQKNKIYPEPFPPLWASEWGEDIHGLWATFIYQNVQQTFRWIPAGEFMMGSPEGEEGRVFWEDLHPVVLTHGFWLADTAVTQAFWSVVMNDNPSYFSDNPNKPVENISWDDVKLFIVRLNEMSSSLNARFPTEAEWEYACRAGTTGAFNFAGELSLDKVNYRGVWEWATDEKLKEGATDVEWGEGARKTTVAVESMQTPNQWGLHEMHGNVWEWCQDTWQTHLGNKKVENPVITEGGVHRVVRGGSWWDDGGRVRSAFRRHFSLSHRFDSVDIGFRLALGHGAQVRQAEQASYQTGQP